MKASTAGESPWARAVPPHFIGCRNSTGGMAGSYPAEGPFMSWAYLISPYMELGTVYSAFNRAAWPWWQYLPGQPATTANMVNGVQAKVMKCPSDPRSALQYLNASENAALTDYFAVFGRDQFAEDGGQNGIMYVNSGNILTSMCRIPI